MNLVLRILIGIFGLMTSVLAIMWLVSPDQGAAQTATTLGSIAAYSNARGDMGGMFLALAIFSIMGVMPRPSAPNWLAALAVLVGAIAGGRLLSLLFDGFVIDVVPALVSEVTAAIAAVVLRSRMTVTSEAVADAVADADS